MTHRTSKRDDGRVLIYRTETEPRHDDRVDLAEGYAATRGWTSPILVDESPCQLDAQGNPTAWMLTLAVKPRPRASVPSHDPETTDRLAAAKIDAKERRKAAARKAWETIRRRRAEAEVAEAGA